MTDRESLWDRALGRGTTAKRRAATLKLRSLFRQERINLVLAYCRTCERQTIHERRGFVFRCERCIEEPDTGR